MNKLIVIIPLAILALFGLSLSLQSGNLSKGHNECINYKNHQQCSQMGCDWDGMMCHPEQSSILLQKHNCPQTQIPEECINSGCEIQGGICVYVD